MFFQNTCIKLFSPPFAALNSHNCLLYPSFCDFYSNHQFYSISRLGEEFFARNSYDQNFGGVKKYEIWAFQRRIARLSSPPQCWDILHWISKTRSTVTFGGRYHLQIWYISNILICYSSLETTLLRKSKTCRVIK